MAKSKYEQLIDGKPTAVKMTRAGNVRINMACCDCGLVHKIGIAVRGAWVGFSATQLPRATAQRRNMLKRKKLGVFAEKGKK